MNGSEIVPPPPPEIKASLSTVPAGEQPKGQSVPTGGKDAGQQPEHPSVQQPPTTTEGLPKDGKNGPEKLVEPGTVTEPAVTGRTDILEDQAETGGETLHQRVYQKWKEGVIMVSHAVGTFDENKQFIPKDRQAIAAELGLDPNNPQTDSKVNSIVQALSNFWAANQVEPDIRGICHVPGTDGKTKPVSLQHINTSILEALELIRGQTAPTVSPDAQPQLTERAQRAGAILDHLKSVLRGSREEGYWFDTREVDNSPELRQEIALTAARVLEGAIFPIAGENDYYFSLLTDAHNLLEDVLSGRQQGSAGDIDFLVSQVTQSARECYQAYAQVLENNVGVNSALATLSLNENYYSEAKNDPMRSLLKGHLIAFRIAAPETVDALLNDMELGKMISLLRNFHPDLVAKAATDRQVYQAIQERIAQFTGNLLTGEEARLFLDMLDKGNFHLFHRQVLGALGIDPKNFQSVSEYIKKTKATVLTRAGLEVNPDNKARLFQLVANLDDEDGLKKRLNVSGLLMKGMVAGMLLSMLQKAFDFGVETVEPAGPR